jgi:SnoaL-like polyketide cyclase
MIKSLTTLSALLLAACAASGSSKLAAYEAAERATATQIATFDTLDFDVFSHQKWDRLHESHAADITVHWPDGHTTKGIDKHISDLKALFVYAPDTRIEVHPVKFGAGEWTSVYGIMEGTFTAPMPIGDGKTIPPNGKSFRLPMATIGHWKGGVMDEEYLFWDNATYGKQLGLAP